MLAKLYFDTVHAFANTLKFHNSCDKGVGGGVYKNAMHIILIALCPTSNTRLVQPALAKPDTWQILFIVDKTWVEFLKPAVCRSSCRMANT